MKIMIDLESFKSYLSLKGWLKYFFFIPVFEVK